jgi:hypothetical protein
MFLLSIIIKEEIALPFAEMLFITVIKSRFSGTLTYIFFILIGIITFFFAEYTKRQLFLFMLCMYFLLLTFINLSASLYSFLNQLQRSCLVCILIQ